MSNFWFPYLVIMAHLLSGAIWLVLIGRKVESGTSTELWTKYFIYLLLFNMIWHSIVWFDTLFPILGYLIIVAGFIEWWTAIKNHNKKLWLTIGFLLVIAGFWKFFQLSKSEILFTFFVVVLFDGSCQIVGQLLGTKLLFPKISPKKTLEGLLGGVAITLATALLVKNSFPYQWGNFLITTCLIMVAAFAGDMLSSAVKRKAGIARFSNTLPGHGGILDRYDSLIMAGGMMYLILLISS